MSPPASLAARYAVQIVAAADTGPLRNVVLRPGRPRSDCVYPGDDAPTTRHYAALDSGGQIVGIASFYREPWAGAAGEVGYRLRGMAIQPELQGHGLGSLLLGQARTELCRDTDLALLWCNARVSAIGFYERLGFAVLGEPFLVPGISELHRIGVWRRA